jgi:hypothetical protein
MRALAHLVCQLVTGRPAFAGDLQPVARRESPIDVIRRHVTADDRKELRFAVKINVLGLGLLALWSGINTILLPLRVEDTAPASLRGSALGLVSLVGVDSRP